MLVAGQLVGKKPYTEVSSVSYCISGLNLPHAPSHFTLEDSQVGEMVGISMVAHFECEAEDQHTDQRSLARGVKRCNVFAAKECQLVSTGR